MDLKDVTETEAKLGLQLLLDEIEEKLGDKVLKILSDGVNQKLDLIAKLQGYLKND